MKGVTSKQQANLLSSAKHVISQYDADKKGYLAVEPTSRDGQFVKGKVVPHVKRKDADRLVISSTYQETRMLPEALVKAKDARGHIKPEALVEGYLKALDKNGNGTIDKNERYTTETTYRAGLGWFLSMGMADKTAHTEKIDQLKGGIYHLYHATDSMGNRPEIQWTLPEQEKPPIDSYDAQNWTVRPGYRGLPSTIDTQFQLESPQASQEYLKGVDALVDGNIQGASQAFSKALAMTNDPKELKALAVKVRSIFQAYSNHETSEPGASSSLYGRDGIFQAISRAEQRAQVLEGSK